MPFRCKIFTIFLIFLINKIKSECNKDEPILFNNECKNYYCTETQFQNGECIISNSAVKKQWLNNIIKFDLISYYLYFFPLQMTNGDYFFISAIASETEDCPYCRDFFIYEYNSSGENLKNHTFYNIVFNEICINAFLLMIDNKNYPLICDTFNCVLLDLYKKKYYTQDLVTFFQLDNFSSRKSVYLNLINLDNKSKILFPFIASLDIYLIMVNINNKELSSIEYIYKANYRPTTFNSLRPKHDFHCLITNNNFIECLYINDDKKLSVAIYNEILDYLNSIILDDDSVTYLESSSTFMNSIKIIHLKNEIGIYAYYIYDIYSTESFQPLRMQIKELYFEDNNPLFKDVIPENQIIYIYTDEFNYYYDGVKRMNYENLIKINDNKFAYTYIYSRSIIVLIIFDLYGNNNDNLYIRYYKINTNLYNLKIVDELRLFKYNLYLGMTFIFYDGNYNEGIEDEYFYDNEDYSLEIVETMSSFLIFGYSTKNIISLDIYKQNQGFIFEIKNYIFIDNNLFGFDLNIKISSVSNSLKGIRFFSIKPIS